MFEGTETTVFGSRLSDQIHHTWLHVRKWVLLVIFAVLWELLPRMGIVSGIVLPPFHEVLITLWHLTISYEILVEASITLQRGFIGYILASLAAIPLGVLLGWQKKLYIYSEGVIEVLRPLPSVALIPVFLLFFGPGFKSIIAIIFYPTFFYQIIATIYGARQIDQTLIDSMKILGISDRKLFTEVFIPGSAPGIITGLRQNMATMLILAIVAEMLLANDGLGSFIMQTQRNFQVAETYAGILAIGIIGYTLNKIFVYIQSRYLYWAERQDDL